MERDREDAHAEPPCKKRASESPTGSPIAVPACTGGEGTSSAAFFSGNARVIPSTPKVLNKEATLIDIDEPPQSQSQSEISMNFTKTASVSIISNERTAFKSPRPLPRPRGIGPSKSLPDPRDIFGEDPSYSIGGEGDEEDVKVPFMKLLATASSASYIPSSTSLLPDATATGDASAQAKGKGTNKSSKAKEKPPKAPKPLTQKEIKARKAAKLAAEKKMSPTEYIATLPSKWDEYVQKIPVDKLYLRGKGILYIWNETTGSIQGTRNKLDIVCPPPLPSSSSSNLKSSSGLIFGGIAIQSRRDHNHNLGSLESDTYRRLDRFRGRK